LNHFCDPAIPFSAQYGTDGPRLVDNGSAYDQVYLLTQAHRSPEARRDALSHLGSYLFHEVTTPLGLRLDQSRLKQSQAPFRSLGTFGVWFPRGLLLRMAARDACQRLMDDWQEGGADPSGLTKQEQSLLQAALARVLADPELQAGPLTARLSELAAEHMDGQPREVLTRLLSQAEEQSRQSLAHDDAGAWARQTFGRMRDWLGSGVSPPGVNVMQQRKSPLTKALEQAAADLAKEWDGRLRDVLRDLMDHGGRRVALAEAAVARLIQFCDERLAHFHKELQQKGRSGQGQAALEEAMQNCVNGAGGWSLFGGRTRRLLRVFVDHLAAYSRQCVSEDMAATVLQFFAALRGRLGDRMSDLGFCRQRLRHVQEMLAHQQCDEDNEPESAGETMTFTRTPGTGVWPVAGSPSMGQTPLLDTETYWRNIREATTNRVVLPAGDSELEQSARRFLRTLTADHWAQLDQAVGEEVLAPRGGLLKMCVDTSDLIRHFAAPLLNQAITCLSQHLPITDVAQVEAVGEGLEDRILSYHALAAPLLAKGARSGLVPVLAGGRGQGSDHGPGVKAAPQSYLLVPASDAGRAFGEAAKEAVPELNLVNVPGQADLMFCREQPALTAADIERILRPCRNPYHEHCLTPNTSPHARFDIVDWTPLDP
jgi:hypothetical protein